MKQLMALLLSFAMLFTLTPAALAVDDFADVKPSDWFYEPVKWAVENGITSGIGGGMFGPNENCTRAQVVTFLWAAAGSPEPFTGYNPFVDVDESDWFCKPVLWAVEQEITGGTSPNTFSPYDVCTRAQVATFLWAAEGKPQIYIVGSPFVDVAEDQWYLVPVVWALVNGITSGSGEGVFEPDRICTRGQIVTFLYAAFKDSVAPIETPTPTPMPTLVPVPTKIPVPTSVPTPTTVPVPMQTPTPAPEPAGNTIYDSRWKSATHSDDVPAWNSEPTLESALAVLDAYDPDGALFFREDGDPMVWWFMDNTLNGSLETAVHESFHGYTHSMGGFDFAHGFSTAFYVGDGKYYDVYETEVFPTEEAAKLFPEHLRTFRYDTYVSEGASSSSNVSGIYGLLNEYSAYCWGLNHTVSLYPYFRNQPMSTDLWHSFYRSGGNNLQAYSEFRFYILSYMLYAEEHEPAVYEGIMANSNLLAALQSMDARWIRTLETYEALHNEVSSMVSPSSVVFGMYTSPYRLLADVMRREDFVRMEQLLGMNPMPTLFE